ALARVRLILFSFAKGILWATSGYLKDGSRDFVQEAGGARRRRGPRLVSASSNRSWQLSVADAVQEVPRRHLQTELMNPVIGGLEAPISRRTRGYENRNASATPSKTFRLAPPRFRKLCGDKPCRINEL